MPDKMRVALDLHEYSADLTSRLDSDTEIDTVNLDILRMVVKKVVIASEIVRYTEWYLNKSISAGEFQKAMKQLHKGKLPNA